MDPFGIGITGLGAAGAATFGAFGLAFRLRRRRLAAQAASELAIAAASASVEAGGGTGPAAPAGRRQGDRERIEAIAGAQAELALRLDALTAAAGAPEEKLQAMAGQLLGLIRDKNATLETAMAGLDQLRARMKALEELGEPAEARGLLEGLKGRIGELETRAAAGAAGLEARLAALASGGGAAELAERLARLHEARDAGLEAALGRLAPLETRLAGVESGIGAGREATRRLEAALAALQGEQAQARTEVAALRAAAETAPARAEARVEAVRAELSAELSARIEAVERARAARDPQAALERLAARIEAVADRLVLVETAENPLAEVSEKLAGLYARKDAALETVLGRLGPLEARLAGFEREIAARDPQGALDRFAERLAAVETAGNPLAGIAESLAALHVRKEAAVEAVLSRLAPLEAALERLAPLETALERLGPLETAVERLERLEGAVSRLGPVQAAAETMGARLGALDAVLDRLGPLEARLASLEGRDDPAAARAMAGEVAHELARLRADAAAQTALFADRLALLESSLPRVDALRGRPAADAASGAVPGEAARAGEETPEEEAIRALPRIVSLHT